MKLEKLLKHMADDDKICVMDDERAGTLFSGLTIDCYQYPKLLKRKVAFLFAAYYEIVIFVK